MKAKTVLFILLSAAVLFGLSGCSCSQDYMFEAEDPVFERIGVGDAGGLTPPQTDILFLIDSSGSMAEEQEALRRNLSHFIVKLAESSNDYQIAVLTPDINSDPNKTMPHCTCSEKNLYLDTWQNNKCCAPEHRDTDNQQCLEFDCIKIVEPEKFVQTSSGKRILKAPRPGPEFNTPEAYQEEKLRLQRELICDFKELVNITGGHSIEQGLEAIRRALYSGRHDKKPTYNDDGDLVDAGGANYGFLRDEAGLVIIIVTDEEDCSHQDMLSNDDIPLYDFDSTCYPFNYNNKIVYENADGALECVDNFDVYLKTGEGRADCSEFSNADGANDEGVCICDNTSFVDPQNPTLTTCGKRIAIDPFVSVDTYANFIKALKSGQSEKISVAVIASVDVEKQGDNFIAGEAMDCCNTETGSGKAAGRYVEFAKKVNEDTWRAENICDGEYQCSLLQVAAIINAKSFFELQSAPLCPNFMQVFVGIGEDKIAVDPKCYGEAMHPDCPDAGVTEVPEGYSAWIYIPPESGGPGLKFEGTAKIMVEQGDPLEFKFAEEKGCGGDKYAEFMASLAVDWQDVELNLSNVCEQELDPELVNVTCE